MREMIVIDKTNNGKNLTDVSFSLTIISSLLSTNLSVKFIATNAMVPTTTNTIEPISVKVISKVLPIIRRTRSIIKARMNELPMFLKTTFLLF
ncbi:hypothetical protein ES705_17737 [subsurface metagenome]